MKPEAADIVVLSVGALLMVGEIFHDYLVPLIRWNRSERRLVSPPEFMPTAENCGARRRRRCFAPTWPARALPPTAIALIDPEHVAAMIVAGPATLN